MISPTYLQDHHPSTIPCLNADPELWHEDHTTPKSVERQRMAKEACGRCPARAACLEQAMADECDENGTPRPVGMRFSIYGGKDKWDRAELAGFTVERPTPRASVGRPPAPIVHGTQNGYVRHRKAGEDPCSECRAAKVASATESKRARKARQDGAA